MARYRPKRAKQPNINMVCYLFIYCRLFVCLPNAAAWYGFWTNVCILDTPRPRPHDSELRNSSARALSRLLQYSPETDRDYGALFSLFGFRNKITRRALLSPRGLTLHGFNDLRAFIGIGIKADAVFPLGKAEKSEREQCSADEHGAKAQVRHSHSAYQTHSQKI